MEEKTLVVTLDEAKKLIREATADARGKATDRSLVALCGAVSRLERVLRYLARSQEQADATAAIFDGLDAGEADKA